MGGTMISYPNPSGQPIGGTTVPGGAVPIRGPIKNPSTPSPQSSGVSIAGEAQWDWFVHSYDLWMEWLNHIDDFITSDESYMMKSPYADFGEAEAISAISTSSPCVVDINSTALSNGDLVLIVGTGAYDVAAATPIGVGDLTIEQYTTTARDLLPKPAQGKLDGHVFTVRGKLSNSVELEGLNTTGWASTPGVGFAYKVTPKTGYDSSASITSIKTEVDLYGDAVTALDPVGATGDYYAAVTRASALVDTLYSDTYIDDVVLAFETRLDGIYSKRTRRFAGGMATAGAQNATGFSIGLALIESEKRREVADFHAQLVMQIEQNKGTAMLNGINEILSGIKNKTEHMKTSALLYSEYYAMKMDLEAQKADADRAFAKSNHTWPLDRFAYGANMFAVQSGAIIPSASNAEMPSGGGYAGAMSGMAAGAYAGNLILPGVGGFIGGVVGAIAGHQRD